MELNFASAGVCCATDKEAPVSGDAHAGAAEGPQADQRDPGDEEGQVSSILVASEATSPEIQPECVSEWQRDELTSP